MLRRRGLALTLVLTLAATLPVAGCSGGTPPQEGAEERAEEGARTSGEAPAHGDRDALGGTLVATGAGLLLTQDLAGDPGRQGGQGGGWQERMTLPAGYAVASVHAAGQELYVAELDSLSPMSVNVYDLETFGHRRSVVWPGTEDLWRVRGLAVAPDGRHLAARVEGSGEASLQILDLATEQVVFASPVDMVTSTMVWTPELELVFATVNPAGGEQDHAGLAAVPLSTFLSADEQIETPLLQTFDRARWGDRGCRRSPSPRTGVLVLPADDSGPHHVDVDAGSVPPAVDLLERDTVVEEVLGWLP